MEWTLIGQIPLDFKWSKFNADLGIKESFLFSYPNMGDDPNKHEPDLTCRFIYEVKPALWATGKTFRIYPRVGAVDLRFYSFNQELKAKGINNRQLEVRMLKPRKLYRWAESSAITLMNATTLQLEVLS